MKPNEISKEIESITEQMVQKYHPLKVVLFGSAVRGIPEHVNDLDFLVVKNDVPETGLERMRELDELIERNVAADILVYREDELEERIRLGDPFVKGILEEGRVLYG